MPHELIIQILLRLPMKSLIRFKCVCKSWLTLISDPHFANSHFQITSKTHIHRLVIISTPNLKTRSIDFETSLNHDSACAPLDLNFTHDLSYFNVEIKGSCNGFIFMHSSSDILLWNSSIGVHKQIPLSPINSNLDDGCFGYLYGFGYDQSTNDYLVVSMSCDPALANISSHLEFFSLRANTWKEIEGIHFPYINASHDPRVGSLFSGSIHWLAFRHDLSINVIVAFDLTERKLLTDDFYCDPKNCDLWVFRGFVSLRGGCYS
ncbi:putative F-box domain-containing protein [Medicago truncatula]|nr:putative F-box domain-containing protein [Medicago truncatula]